MKKPALASPALIAATLANTPQGQRAIGSAIDKAEQVSSGAFKTVKNIIFLGLAIGAGHWVYKKIINRFTKIAQDVRYKPAKINEATALAKAESIYTAMKGIGNGFASVKANLAGLSHNDYIKVYNAFGNRQGAIPFSQEMNLTEWLQDEFKNGEFTQLKFLLPTIL